MKLILFLSGLSVTWLIQAQSNFEEMKNINGTRLFIKSIGKKEPLIFIHGGPGLNHSYFRPFTDALSKDFTVVYYDQRACGKSAIPPADSVSMNLLVDDLDAIRKELKVERINLLAHSWGSILVVNYAINYPDRVNKMILSNPVPLSKEYDKETQDFIIRHTSREDSLARTEIISKQQFDLSNFEKLFRISFRATAFNPSNIEKIHLSLPENFTIAQRALFQGLSKDLMQYNFYADATKFQFPVLIIHGKADGIPLSSINRLQGSIPGASVEIFKQSGHFPFAEETDKFNQAVSSFLKRKK